MAKVFKALEDTKAAQNQKIKQLEAQKKMNKEKLEKVFKALEDSKTTQDQTIKQLKAIQTENTRLSRELEETKEQINKLKNREEKLKNQ